MVFLIIGDFYIDENNDITLRENWKKSFKGNEDYVTFLDSINK